MSPADMAALHAACFTTPRPWSAAEIAGLMGDAGVFAVAVPQGFAMGRAVLDEAELLTLAVAPSARRGGHGRALLAAFEAEARRRDAGRGFLEVAADNLAATSLYRLAGWRESGVRKGYYRHPDGRRTDALVFDKCLKQGHDCA